MRNITARNLGAALSYLGADVESALLELASVSPQLDAKVRKELYRDCTPGRLRSIKDRGVECIYFVALEQPRWACIMHAIDYICQVLENALVVQYLETKFSGYSDELQALQER